MRTLSHVEQRQVELEAVGPILLIEEVMEKCEAKLAILSVNNSTQLGAMSVLAALNSSSEYAKPLSATATCDQPSLALEVIVDETPSGTMGVFRRHHRTAKI